jgi:hypothetical protein
LIRIVAVHGGVLCRRAIVQHENTQSLQLLVGGAVNCWKLSFFLLSILFIRGRVIWIWLQELAKKAKHYSPPNISLGSVSDTVGRSDAADVGAEEQHDYLK